MNADPELHSISRSRVEALASLGDNWNGHTSKPPTIDALRVLRYLSVVPTIDGGVQIEWHFNGWDVEIGVSAQGEPDGFSCERWKES